MLNVIYLDAVVNNVCILFTIMSIFNNKFKAITIMTGVKNHLSRGIIKWKSLIDNDHSVPRVIACKKHMETSASEQIIEKLIL